MATQSAFTTVTLRRLPQGESLQITISGNKSLNILRDKDAGSETPNLATDNIVLTPAVYGTSGTTATLSSCTWKMLIGTTEQTDTEFGKMANWNSGTGVLTLTKSPMAAGIMTSPQPFSLVFSGKATLNNHTYDVKKTLVVNYAEISQNSYWGSIVAESGTTLDENTASTKLKPTLYLGTKAVSVTPTVVWYKTGAGTGGADLQITKYDIDGDGTQEGTGDKYLDPGTNQKPMWKVNGNELTVYRDGVDAAAHFEAHFYVGGKEVEAEGVSIVDVTDTLQIEEMPDQYASAGNTATFTVRAFNSKSGSTIKLTSASQLKVTVSDSIRQGSYTEGTHFNKSVNTETGLGSVSMNESNLYVPNPGSEDYPKATYPWLKCGDSAAQDVGVTADNKEADATQCEAIFLIGAEIEM